MIWNIVADSSCDVLVSSWDRERIRFESVPLRILVGETEYVDDDALVIPELLNAMAAEKSASSTACPSPEAFAQAFAAGDYTICFTISANLSGTYNAAVLARDLVLEDYPDKKICIIDSKSTAGAMALLIKKAAELMEADPEGENFDGICDQLRMYQASQRTVFTLEAYDNLIKNGRMRPLVGNLLHSLGIHVIADATPQGTIHVCGKAKGELRTFKALVQHMGESKDCTGADVVIHHCENLTGAMRLRDVIVKELPVKNVSFRSCRGLTTYYAMQNGLIVSF